MVKRISRGGSIPEGHQRIRVSPSDLPQRQFMSTPARSRLGLLGLSLLMIVSCDSQSAKTNRVTVSNAEANTSDSDLTNAQGTLNPDFSDGLDGTTLLQNLTLRYSMARSYQDKGVLLLTYKLEGKSIKEPHPFSTIWDRSHKLACRLFKGHLQANGKLLSCYVFDINTANLDEQQLYLPIDHQLPLTQLFEDSIVRHYLGGYADLPLDETNKTQTPKLIPPPISLLTGQIPFGWIQSPQVAKRLPDQVIGQRTFFVVRSQYDNMTADLWIDQETKLLTQISMPLKIMDRQVLTSGEISDVELMLRFDDASIDSPATSNGQEVFSTSLKSKATPVRRFVSVPDPFPSERIGQLVPKFELLQPNGNRIDHLHFDGKTTVLLWIGSTEWDAVAKKFQQLREASSVENVEWGIVYSETELAQPDASSLQAHPQLTKIANQIQTAVLFDRQLQTSSKLKLQGTPAIIVISPNSRLEYVGSLAKDNWNEELAVIVEKVHRGLDVASEMKQAYQAFQDQYQKQRLAASARSLLNLPETGISSIANLSNGDEPAIPITWKPTLTWTNKSLTKPGNIAVNLHQDPPSLLIMDGWRTVVELDLQGRELGRHQLDLPEQGAVSCLRVAPRVPIGSQPDVQTDSPQFAGFNVQADRVYLFDRNWKRVADLPPTDFPHDGIRDVLFQARGTEKPLVVAALANAGGCIEFDCESRVMKQVFRSRADSIVRSGNEIFFANSTNWGRLQDESELVPATEELMYQRLISVESITPEESGFVGITSVDRENNWYFGGLGSDGKLAWRQPIGAQLFENELEPLSGCSINVRGRYLTVIAIADASNRVTLVSSDGSYLGQFAAPAPLSGISLVEHQGSLHLVLSTDQGLANYRLAAGGVTAIPASSPRN